MSSWLITDLICGQCQQTAVTCIDIAFCSALWSSPSSGTTCNHSFCPLACYGWSASLIRKVQNSKLKRRGSAFWMNFCAMATFQLGAALRLPDWHDCSKVQLWFCVQSGLMQGFSVECYQLVLFRQAWIHYKQSCRGKKVPITAEPPIS